MRAGTGYIIYCLECVLNSLSPRSGWRIALFALLTFPGFADSIGARRHQPLLGFYASQAPYSTAGAADSGCWCIRS
jgi:hypothetical protein